MRPAPRPARALRAMVAAVALAMLGALLGAAAFAPRGNWDVVEAGAALEAQARRTLAEIAARRAPAEALTALLAADKHGTIARVIAADPPAARARLDEIAPTPEPSAATAAVVASTVAAAPPLPAEPPPAAAVTAAHEAPAAKVAAFRPGFDNRDIAGAQIAVLRDLDAPSCLDACRRRADCRAFVFDKWNRTCRLKAGVTAFRLNPRATSALREDVPVPRPPAGPVAMERYPSKAFPGEGYRVETAAGPQDCEALCRDDGACVAFTFRLDEGVCHLFATTGEYFTNALADSGGKRQD